LLGGIGEVLVQAVRSYAGGSGNDRADAFGVVDGELERGCRSHAVPEDVGAVNAEVVEQSGDVTGQGGRRDGALDVRSAAVALQLDADDGVAAGEGRDEGGEVQVDGEHPAVQQHEWGAVAVFLVVQVQAVDVGVAGLAGGRSRWSSSCCPRSVDGFPSNPSVTGYPATRQ